jgi:hypothetical protein
LAGILGLWALTCSHLLVEFVYENSSFSIAALVMMWYACLAGLLSMKRKWTSRALCCSRRNDNVVDEWNSWTSHAERLFMVAFMAILAGVQY